MERFVTVLTSCYGWIPIIQRSFQHVIFFATLFSFQVPLAEANSTIESLS